MSCTARDSAGVARRDKVRPVLINNWEAAFMNFTEEKILNIARTAATLGVELMVLDDGWFGKRDDATSPLGDWYPDLSKLPEGITGVAKKVEALGMKFGLWIEPETGLNHESRLYREHPDWLLGEPGRPQCQRQKPVCTGLQQAGGRKRHRRHDCEGSPGSACFLY